MAVLSIPPWSLCSRTVKLRGAKAAGWAMGCAGWFSWSSISFRHGVLTVPQP